MRPLHLARVLATLPVFATSAAAQQDSTVARDTAARPAPASVAPVPVAARRDTALPGLRPPTPARRQARHSSDDQVSAMLFTLVAPAIGGVAGSLHGDACFGNAEKMANRALLTGFAMAIPGSMLLQHVANRDTGTPAPPRAQPASASRTGFPMRDMLILPVAGAAFGAVLGAPIGAVQGGRHPERCGGGIGGGTGRGAAQMAVGGAVVGAGWAAIIGFSELAMRIGDDRAGSSDSVAARARRAGIRMDTLRGRQDPYNAARLAFVIPGAAHFRAGERERGALFAALTYGLVAVAMQAAPETCAESGAGEGCTRKQNAVSVGATGAAALVWALGVADGYGAAERHNRRLVERAVARAGAR